MSIRSKKSSAAPVREVFETDDVRAILKDSFFDSNGRAPRVTHREADESTLVRSTLRAEAEVAEVREVRDVSVADTNAKKKPKPDHYKVICISLYNEDLKHLDDIVQALKERGFTKANRSAVLRAAMLQFDPNKVNKGL